MVKEPVLVVVGRTSRLALALGFWCQREEVVCGRTLWQTNAASDMSGAGGGGAGGAGEGEEVH